MVSLVCLVCLPFPFDCERVQIGKGVVTGKVGARMTSETANKMAGHAEHLCTMHTLNRSNLNYFCVQIFVGRIFRVGEDFISRNTL